MFDRKSDYALNKKDPNAIVFKTAAGAYIRLHREDFSSEDEFLKWKGWSDEDYRVVDVRNNAYTKLTVSLERIPEQIGALSPEQLLIEQYDQLDREQFCRLLLEGINTCLSETQRRRLLKYYFEGQTEVEIATAEKVSQISQAKAAPLMGISQTALSQYRRSMYDNGDISALESKLTEFFKAQDEQTASTEKALPYKPIQDYIPTSISEDVYKLIRYCQLEKGMVIIHGDAGIGKTKGAEKFVRDNPTSSVYIQATPSTGTVGSVLSLVARALRVTECRKKVELIAAIREKLDGTNRIIIIDEAQHLQLRALDEIRAWTEPNPENKLPGIGIALIGNSTVYSRMAGRQDAQFSQLFSRIRMNRLYSTREVTAEDVKALFPKLCEEGQKKEAAFLHGICQSKWGVRGAVNVYNNAVNNEDITYTGLYNMARNMGIGVV